MGNKIEHPRRHYDTDIANFTPKQQSAIDLLKSGTIKYLLYGGAMGGGKSRFLRWAIPRHLIKMAGKGVEKPVAMLACEDYPSLADRQIQKVVSEFPPYLGQHYADHKLYKNSFILSEEYGGGVMVFRNLDDPSKYMSAEFCLIAIDELTKNTYEKFMDLMTRLRWPGLTDIECPFLAGTNPGGIGHGWVKQLWVNKQFPVEWTRPVDKRPWFGFVQSLADDNPYLDASYWDSLEAQPEAKRRAYRYGDWDIFVGQAFPELTRRTHEYRSVSNTPPAEAWLGMSFDWGFGKPFSANWFYTDADGRLFMFAEWYGCIGVPDEGLRMPDTDILDGIINREKEMGIWGRPIFRKGHHECFQKKPNYRGGGQGPSTAEVFREKGVVLTPSDPSRELKIRQFRERLKIPTDGTMPMLMVADQCNHFFRTLGALVMDENNVEDVDTKGEDHAYDSVAMMCMARPLASQPAVKVIKRPPKDGSEAAWLEHKQIMAEIRGEGQFDEGW